MAEFLTFDTDLTAVANAIRAKGGTSAQLIYPSGFVSAIQAIQTGITPKLVVTTTPGAAITATPLSILYRVCMMQHREVSWLMDMMLRI